MTEVGHTEAYVLNDENKLIGKLSIHGAIKHSNAPVKDTLDSRSYCALY